MEKVQSRVNTPINHWRIQFSSQASRTIDTLVVTERLVSRLLLKKKHKINSDFSGKTFELFGYFWIVESYDDKLNIRAL